MPVPINIAIPPIDPTGNSNPWASVSHSLTNQGATSPPLQSPGRASFLPSFSKSDLSFLFLCLLLIFIVTMLIRSLYHPVRRPRASTTTSLNAPPLTFEPTPRSTDSIPSSTDHPPTPPAPSRRSTQPIPQSPPSSYYRALGSTSPGMLMNAPKSPPLSTSHREDPLAHFGARLMRRISNQGPSAGNGNGSPARSASTPPVARNGPSEVVGTSSRSNPSRSREGLGTF